MNNYNTSRDYELLWELIKTQNVIGILYDTPYLINRKNADNESLDTFVKNCEFLNLEFILPNAWISVKDRLPEEGKYVLTYSNSGVAINFLISDNYWVITEEDDVTHWQHLPEPPKGE